MSRRDEKRLYRAHTGQTPLRAFVPGQFDALALNLEDFFREKRTDLFGVPTHANEENISVAKVRILAVGYRPGCAHIERLLRERLAMKRGAQATLIGYEAPSQFLWEIGVKAPRTQLG